MALGQNAVVGETALSHLSDLQSPLVLSAALESAWPRLRYLDEDFKSAIHLNRCREEAFQKRKRDGGETQSGRGGICGQGQALQKILVAWSTYGCAACWANVGDGDRDRPSCSIVPSIHRAGVEVVGDLLEAGRQAGLLCFLVPAERCGSRPLTTPYAGAKSLIC
jgi:hypothetical protein